MATPEPLDGGAAFPVSDVSGSSPTTVAEMKRNARGMSLRDYFAGQFMERAQSLSEYRDGSWDFHNAAQCAYQMADAMLEARAAS